MDITATEQADVTVVAIGGRMTLGRESLSVESSVEKWIAEGKRKFVFELSQLQYMDSSALGILISCSSKAKQAGGFVRLAAVSERVMRILDLTGSKAVLQTFETIEAACRP